MVIALFPEAYILGLQIFEQIMLVRNHVPHVYIRLWISRSAIQSGACSPDSDFRHKH